MGLRRNEEVAEALERIADLLEAQRGSRHRIRAYRTAARNVRSMGTALEEILREEGRDGLMRLPGIGKSIAALIDEYLHTARMPLLDRLEGQVSPEDLFTTVPGIGEDLAHKIHAKLQVETLEELEIAAHDGRLETVRGIGRRRAQGIRETLAGILGRSSRRHARWRRWVETGDPRVSNRDDLSAEGSTSRPDVAMLLDIDSTYRSKAKGGELHTIIPRRFNPEGRSWLPVLHCERAGWSMTALFSNTARAHELAMTGDWVVIYYERDGEEDQCTVVTERVGPLHGRRVVRAREAECARHYAAGGPTVHSVDPV